MADIYLDVIGPLFARKCTSCHNEDKRRGGLSLLSYASVRKGGESGEVIKPFDPKGSELYRRVTLAPTQEDYMPKNHKNPPTPEELEALRYWIEIGAPGSGRIAELKPPPAVRASLRRVLGL
jgi:cytochrome c